MNQRILTERLHHDAEAAGRSATFARNPDRLRMSDAEYLDHAPWIRPAIAQLGNLPGKRILDLGCGHGMASVVFSRMGGNVTGCDLSAGYIAEAVSRAKANETVINFTVCAGELLPFSNESFNIVWGHAILHHLELPAALVEIRRVLRVGGVGLFCEPWDGNPVIRWLRRWRQHTPDEQAFMPKDIQCMRGMFESVQVQRYQLGRYVVIAVR